MEVNKLYEVTKRIKIHTKPLVICNVVLTGKFKKETDSMFIFDNFRVNKRVVISIKEVQSDTDNNCTLC